MDHIFISYRRDDAADVTGRIHDRLREHFGKEAIFADVDKIPLGDDFREHLDQMMGQCKVLLPVIGRDWINVTDREGKPRLEDPADFVRLEIEAALERNIAVIPLLVHGIEMPTEESLPGSLKPLVFRNATPIRRDPDFHSDMDRLIKAIEQCLKFKKTKKDRRSGDSGRTVTHERATKPVDPEKLSMLYTEGLSAYYTEQWDDAVSVFSRIAEFDKSYEGVEAKLTEATRQQQLSQLYDRAKTARKKKTWRAAAKYLREIVALDANYRDASAWLEEARTKNRLQRLYSEARQLRQAEKWQAAISVLDRIESLDAVYPDPDGIRNTATQAIESLAREEQLSDWYSTAVRLLDTGDWQATLQTLESIEGVDSSYRDTRALLTRVRRKLDDEEERSRKNRERDEELARQSQSGQPGAEKLPENVGRPKPTMLPEAARNAKPDYLPGSSLHVGASVIQPQTVSSKPATLPEPVKTHAKPTDLPQ